MLDGSEGVGAQGGEEGSFREHENAQSSRADWHFWPVFLEGRLQEQRKFCFR